MNVNQNKDNKSGKFVKEQQNKADKDREYILKVKDRLYAGYTDIDEIREAYRLIIGDMNTVNVMAMKRAIINYN